MIGHFIQPSELKSHVREERAEPILTANDEELTLPVVADLERWANKCAHSFPR